MINIYLVIILCGLLLANAGFFCGHHGLLHRGKQLTATAKQQITALPANTGKDKLTELENRLEQLAQELTGVSKTVNRLSKTLHSKKLQNSPGDKTNKQPGLTTTAISANKAFTAPARVPFVINTR
ncbi:hypothetical protein [Thalassomonas haliotis]|uniref:Uncharacterized protein n=1 Tax=Thalassomonas haliotis TaxID=485448 RepID=A0ABY7V7Y7_9GAMM|nr:hypothetical protein [Thalassomonas haliotis]WDE09749.1 hypothetical protein H3N35_15635 [Thalassomonas haliotis]